MTKATEAPPPDPLDCLSKRVRWRAVKVSELSDLELSAFSGWLITERRRRIEENQAALKALEVSA